MNYLLFVIAMFSPLIFAAEQTEQDNNADKSSASVRVQGQLGMTITGNQELPNVLYIIPWQKAQGANISPIQGRIVDEVFGPIEARVFQRQIRLYRDLQALEQVNEAKTSTQ